MLLAELGNPDKTNSKRMGAKTPDGDGALQGCLYLKLIYFFFVFMSTGEADLLERSKQKFVDPSENGTIFYLSDEQMSFTT